MNANAHINRRGEERWLSALTTIKFAVKILKLIISRQNNLDLELLISSCLQKYHDKNKCKYECVVRALSHRKCGTRMKMNAQHLAVSLLVATHYLIIDVVVCDIAWRLHNNTPSIMWT